MGGGVACRVLRRLASRRGRAPTVTGADAGSAALRLPPTSEVTARGANPEVPCAELSTQPSTRLA
jgi:hypothetical protein